ncbi:MAG: ATP synthase F1 subunit epsilon [Clostridiales bacterium]|jgi:F-type H+-transporting ATPase subunit epsilon|nr:ATP synthase F1 subunit epsilon [Clostridiales bacterium]
MALEKTFRCVITTPDREFYVGEIESLSVSTPHGSMGILRHTLPLVSAISAGTVAITQKGKRMEAMTGEGFIEVTPGGAVLAVLTAEWPYEIDVNRAKTEYSDAEKAVRKAQSLREYKIAKAQLVRQLAKLKITDRE